ncbi:MAG: hypothetical protein EPGJADBJ_01642 [Saprospiraceae bacterium]|nr:hypothetical protein [Saprospiraceae bacterium]
MIHPEFCNTVKTMHESLMRLLCFLANSSGKFSEKNSRRMGTGQDKMELILK